MGDIFYNLVVAVIRDNLPFRWGGFSGEILRSNHDRIKVVVSKTVYRKRSADETDEAAPPPKKSKEDEAVLKKQSDKLFSLQKKLEKEMTKRQMQEIFEYNGMNIPQGISRLVEWLVSTGNISFQNLL